MADSIDLSGHWAGHYFQHGVAHPITAELIQVGERLTGTMRDGDTEFEQSVFAAAHEAGLPPGADEQIEEELRKLYPDVRKGPIRSAMHLPADSVLQGNVQGRTVRFLKTYQGQHFSGYRIGDRKVGVSIERHAVQYRGEISSDCTEIEGRWWIPQPLESPGRRVEGSFLLHCQVRTTANS